MAMHVVFIMRCAVWTGGEQSIADQDQKRTDILDVLGRAAGIRSRVQNPPGAATGSVEPRLGHLAPPVCVLVRVRSAHHGNGFSGFEEKMDVAPIRTSPFRSLVPPLSGNHDEIMLGEVEGTVEVSCEVNGDGAEAEEAEEGEDGGSLEDMTLVQLQAACRQAKLSAKGNKATLRKRLRENP